MSGRSERNANTSSYRCYRAANRPQACRGALGKRSERHEAPSQESGNGGSDGSERNGYSVGNRSKRDADPTCQSRDRATRSTDAIGDPQALVFVGERGAILRRRFAERTFKPAVVKAGPDPSLTFHGLRHVAMSTLIDEKVHPRVMQSRAGHASSKLTMELYAHVTDKADRYAANALDDRFRAALRDPNGHAAGTESDTGRR